MKSTLWLTLAIVALCSGLPAKTKKSSTSIVLKPTTPKSPSTLTGGSGTPFNLTFVVQAKDLPVKKKDAKLDPYIKVSHRTGTLQELKDWAPIGQTEQLKKTNSPEFLKVFSFLWTKGKNQQWQFEVLNKKTLGKDEVVGTATVKIDEYVLEKNQDMSVKLNAGGMIIVQKVQPVKFKLYARNVPKLDTLNGKSDPFVECYWRIGKNGNDTLFHTTKTINDSENPDWDEVIEFPNYMKGKDMWWHFKVYDSDSVSGNDYVGESLVEMDPFVTKRAAKLTHIDKKNTKVTLTLTPA